MTFRHRSHIGCTAALVLAACSSEADRAVEAYEIAKESGLSPSDICAAAGEAKDAFLAEGNQDQYELWALTEYSDCAYLRR